MQHPCIHIRSAAAAAIVLLHHVNTSRIRTSLVGNGATGRVKIGQQ